jgi:hypothetical protein
VTEEKLGTVGPLEDWDPEEITCVRKLLSEVKQENILKSPNTSLNRGLLSLSTFLIKQVDTEMKGVYGSSALDVLVKSIRERRQPHPPVKPPELIVQETTELGQEK